MQLRPATPADAPALAALGRESFSGAFAHLYQPEDLAAFLAEVHDEAAVAAEIAGPVHRHCLAVDEASGQLLGYCKLAVPGKLAADAQAENPIELSQLYCAPTATGQGVGAALMEWALAEGQAGGHDAMILSVYCDNHGAQRFYHRYGFAKTADIHFRVGQQLDEEYLYEKPLTGARA